MNELENRLEGIRLNLESLIAQNKQLTEENEQLISELLNLKETTEQNEKRIHELENKNINLQLSNSIEGDDKNKFKYIINGLIKEIDKGLELLKS